jgi:hypothetical protein
MRHKIKHLYTSVFSSLRVLVLIYEIIFNVIGTQFFNCDERLENMLLESPYSTY